MEQEERRVSCSIPAQDRGQGLTNSRQLCAQTTVKIAILEEELSLFDI
jgi:hypothetical protein